MLLNNGVRIGGYEILSLIGAGGMGEVYRARDHKLKRDVALKVLPDAFASDPERMARLQREAEVLASLNHPHIAAIYGFQESALVMELVEGESLDRSLPLHTALNYARQIAEALEYAHERGVIHRDLKPANVKVTPDGAVKLLDFGLAKAIEDPAASEDPSASPTLTLGATHAGVILGTAAYMSPEQAQGKNADRRSDIFSFGAVLYEMLTGRRAFAGESVPDTLASVLKLEPDWSALPPDTPPSIRTLLRRCLIKDRKHRLQAIGEARIVLENPAEPAVSIRQARPWLWIAATALMTVVAGIALWGWLRLKPPELRPSTHFATTLTPAILPGGRIAISPDGSRIAFPTQKGIYVRSIDQPEVRFIPNTENAAAFLSFSRDGQSIAFVATAGGLVRIRHVSLKGAVRDVVTVRGGQLPIHWGFDDNIYFADIVGVLRIPLNGGQPQTLVPAAKGSYFPLQLLPDKKTLLVGGRRPEEKSFGIGALELSTGVIKPLIIGATVRTILAYAANSEDPNQGHIVYEGPSSLFEVPFDARQVRLNGPAVAIPDLSPFMDISDQGTLAYIVPADSDFRSRQLVWVNRQGVAEPLTLPARPYTAPLRISPDGERLAVIISGDLWIADLRRGSLTKITSGGRNANPMWTFDGKNVIYSSRSSQDRTALSSVPADRSGPPTVLTKDDGFYLPSMVTPDGKAILVRREDPSSPNGGGTYLAFPIDRDARSIGEGKPFLESRGQISNMQISPDGQFVAYQSSETGRLEINVTSYPGPGAILTISTDGGVGPRWSRNGRELFYLNSGKVMVVEVLQTTPQFRAGPPKVLFEGRPNDRDPWDVALDGRFLMFKSSGEGQTQPDELHIITNWFDQLRRLAPPRR